MQQHYDGLRSFLAECDKLGEVKVIRNADWNLEIGALTETACELIDEPPALMFDEIAGYPQGFRVLSIDDRIEKKLASELSAGGHQGIGGVAAWMGWPDDPAYRAREKKYLESEIESMSEALNEMEKSSDRASFRQIQFRE